VTETPPGPGWANLRHPELYADLRQAGSLNLALKQVVAESGTGVSVISPDSDVNLLSATLAGAERFHRDPIPVSCAGQTRSFGIVGWIRGVYTLSGGTPDLREIVRFVAAWNAGMALADLQDSFPWIHIEDKAFAHEKGPAEAVAFQWERVKAQMRGELTDGDFPLGMRLVEAAYAEPRLRQLYAYTSHWVLCFSRCVGYPFTDDIPCIDYVIPEQLYRVRRPGWGDTTRTLSGPVTAEEAVAIVVAHLPAGTGAAVAGTADEL